MLSGPQISTRDAHLARRRDHVLRGTTLHDRQRRLPHLNDSRCRRAALEPNPNGQPANACSGMLCCTLKHATWSKRLWSYELASWQRHGRGRRRHRRESVPIAEVWALAWRGLVRFGEDC